MDSGGLLEAITAILQARIVAPTGGEGERGRAACRLQEPLVTCGWLWCMCAHLAQAHLHADSDDGHRGWGRGFCGPRAQGQPTEGSHETSLWLIKPPRFPRQRSQRRGMSISQTLEVQGHQRRRYPCSQDSHFVGNWSQKLMVLGAGVSTATKVDPTTKGLHLGKASWGLAGGGGEPMVCTVQRLPDPRWPGALES